MACSQVAERRLISFSRTSAQEKPLVPSVPGQEGNVSTQLDRFEHPSQESKFYLHLGRNQLQKQEAQLMVSPGTWMLLSKGVRS
jgi:hypothetical protein